MSETVKIIFVTKGEEKEFEVDPELKIESFMIKNKKVISNILLGFKFVIYLFAMFGVYAFISR